MSGGNLYFTSCRYRRVQARTGVNECMWQPLLRRHFGGQELVVGILQKQLVLLSQDATDLLCYWM